MNFEASFQQFLQTNAYNESRLQKAIQFAGARPGKRLRPQFVLETAAIVGLELAPALRLGHAVECIHLFSLVHDDLPCLDNDDFRGGIPTLHRQFDEPFALLAGDALFQLGYDEFLNTESLIAPTELPHFFKSFQFFSKCIGQAGLIGGQCLELELTGSASLENLLNIQDLKTGALFRASLLCPALLKGLEPGDELFGSLLRFANDFSFAFQIADDLEDEVQDQAAGVKNILSHMGRAEAIRYARERLEHNPLADRFAATAKLKAKLC